MHLEEGNASVNSRRNLGMRE